VVGDFSGVILTIDGIRWEMLDVEVCGNGMDVRKPVSDDGKAMGEGDVEVSDSTDPKNEATVSSSYCSVLCISFSTTLSDNELTVLNKYIQ